MSKLYSFDIFDTLITRRVARPVGIFALMQDKIRNDITFSDFPQDVKANFFKYRKNSEFRQRRFNHLWKNKVDITLDQIYQDIKETYNLSDAQCELLKSLEIALEIENVLPIEANIAKLKKLIADGKRVVLISDMYLPETVIKQMLYKCDEVLPTLKVYLSSNIGAMKKTGELYKFVQKEECVEFSQWSHLGDNKNSDYEQALGFGIKAKLYKYIALKKYERVYLDKDIENSLAHLLVGCSKNLRLQYGKSSKFDLGASLGGGILYPYVSWLLYQAQKSDIKTLYFIARDGFVLKKMADILIEKKNLDIKTVYLYSSRKAWRLPSLTIENKEHYYQYIEAIGSKAYNKLGEVLGLTKKELLEYISSKYLKLNYYSKQKDKSALKEVLKQNENLLANLVEKNKANRVASISYLKQTISSNEKSAFVELIGSGFTQNCLCELIKEFYSEQIITFYFANTLHPFELHSQLLKKYFYVQKNPLMAMYLELFARAPHGQTIGYEEKDGHWEPILEDSIGLMSEEYVAGLIEYTKDVCNLEQQYPEYCFQDQTIMEAYTTFMYSTVDKETAEILGSLTHCFYGAEKEEFAPKIRLFEALRYLITGKIRTESILYSKTRSRGLVRKIIDKRFEILSKNACSRLSCRYKNS